MDKNIQPQISQQPTHQSTPPPIPIEQKPSRSWIKWVLFIIVAVLLSSTATYFVLQSQSQKQPSLPAEVSTKAGPTPSPDLYREPTGSTATANWKTYTESNNMFSFKYPADLNGGKVTISTNFSPNTLFGDTLSIIRKDKNFSPQNALIRVQIDHPYSLTYPDGQADPFTLTITVWVNKENITNDQLKTEFLSYKPPPGPYQTSFVDIQDYQNGEIKGVYFIVMNDQDHQEIYMATKDKLYNFFFSSESTSTSGNTRKLINQILSTFQFAN